MKSPLPFSSGPYATRELASVSVTCKSGGIRAARLLSHWSYTRRHHSSLDKANALHSSQASPVLHCPPSTACSAPGLIKMGVPFESLLPYAICLGFFGVTGAALSKIRHMQNGGKRPRRSIDQWDKQMMDRDRRLTGYLRGQTDNVRAPAGFELSNPWRMERGIS